MYVFCTLLQLQATTRRTTGAVRLISLNPCLSLPAVQVQGSWQGNARFPNLDRWAATTFRLDAVSLPFLPTDILTHVRRVG